MKTPNVKLINSQQTLDGQTTDKRLPRWMQHAGGATVLLLLVLAVLVLLFLTPKQSKADEIDWSFASDYSTALEHCNARTIGTPYPVLGGSQEYNCMLHNGYTQIVHDGQLAGWDDGRGNQYLGVEVLYVE